MPANVFARVAVAYTLCSDIISAIDFRPARAPNLVRFRLTFTDGSCLHVSEDWQSGALGAYSYYWLDSTNALIVGWDNSPHHTEISTFPHHKHVGSQDYREPSNETTLEDVLAVIRARLASVSSVP
jgi:hypothetical protein